MRTGDASAGASPQTGRPADNDKAGGFRRVDRCGYCGGENEAGALLCGGCGSRLDEVGTQKHDRRPKAAPTRGLNAVSATLILLCDQATMLLLGVGIAFVAYVLGAHQGDTGLDIIRK